MTVYIILLAVAALAVSSVGAFFSVSGLAKLFAGASLSVMFMAGALEFAKVVAAAFLHRAWKDINPLIRAYMTVAVAVLVGITSMGIFGYLSHAYQATSEKLRQIDLQVSSIQVAERDLENELSRIQTVINMIPDKRVTKRIEAQKEYEPRINELNAKLLQFKTRERDLNMTRLSSQVEVGPLIYVAAATGRDPDQVAQWLILTFVSVFDPLAICLVVATSSAVKVRAKEREREQLQDLERRSKAAAHNLTAVAAMEPTAGIVPQPKTSSPTPSDQAADHATDRAS